VDTGASGLVLSALPKLFMLDLDGVVLRHNGYLSGADALLPGAERFWRQIRPQDTVIALTARPESQRAATLSLLAEHDLRVDHAIFDLPTGERILLNDRKPSGLATAFAVNLARDEGLSGAQVTVDPSR